MPKFVTVTYGFAAFEAGDGHAGDADSVGELVLVEAVFLACAAWCSPSSAAAHTSGTVCSIF